MSPSQLKFDTNMHVFVVDDHPRFLEHMVEELNGLPEKPMVCDFRTDFRFMDSVLEKLPNIPLEDVVLIIDLELYISQPHWAMPAREDMIDKNCKYGVLRYTNYAVHGLNMYYYIRSLYRKLKIAVISSHRYGELNRLTNGDGIPEYDPYFRYIERSSARKDIADVHNFFLLKI